MTTATITLFLAATMSGTTQPPPPPPPPAPAAPTLPTAPAKPTEPATADAPKSADWPFTADKLERVAEGYNFTEGPTWVRGQDGKPGFFIFCEKGKSIVHRWDGGADKPVAIRTESNGAVGSTSDPAGNIYQVDSATRSISKWSVKDGKAADVKVLADKLDDKKLGGMNDCAYHANGSVYATSGTWFLPRDDNKVDFQGVIRVGKDGKVTKVAEGLRAPNGVCFSPDGKKAYVTEFGDARIVSYPVKDDGTFGEKSVFAELKRIAGEHGVKGGGGADGIRCDSKGNVFSSGPGGVWVLTSDAKFIAHLPTGISNLSFGGADGKTLLITTFDGVSKIGTKNAGAGW
jgi:gluconolactonase